MCEQDKGAEYSNAEVIFKANTKKIVKKETAVKPKGVTKLCITNLLVSFDSSGILNRKLSIANPRTCCLPTF